VTDARARQGANHTSNNPKLQKTTMLISGLLGLILLVLGIMLFVFWIWMLVDCIKNTALSDTEKIVWVLVIIFLHFLGALIYMLAGRNK
jgi:Phospholipase_D-nuclease N-terminal